MNRTLLISITSMISLGTMFSAIAHEKSETIVDKAKKEKTRTVADYDTQKILGWTIHVEKTAKANPKYEAAIKLLNANLAEIIKIINPEIVVELKKVPFWLNNNSRDGAEYHPSGKWLKDNSFMVEKAQCIELQSVSSYVGWSASQPMVILHELAHAFHHRVHKFKQPEITKAFNKAVADKTYEKVKHINGKEKRHYAMTDEKEYFSECTEAYFGKNDFYPFTRAELKKHDPTGYAMVESVWKVKAEK